MFALSSPPSPHIENLPMPLQSAIVERSQEVGGEDLRFKAIYIDRATTHVYNR